MRRVERDAEEFFSACRGRSGGALIPETIENREKMEGTGGETESREKRRSVSVALARHIYTRARARALSVDSRRSPKTVHEKKYAGARERACFVNRQPSLRHARVGRGTVLQWRGTVLYTAGRKDSEQANISAY